MRSSMAPSIVSEMFPIRRTESLHIPSARRRSSTFVKAKLKITLRHFHREGAGLESTGVFGWALHPDDMNERSKPFGQHYRIFQR